MHFISHFKIIDNIIFKAELNKVEDGVVLLIKINMNNFVFVFYFSNFASC